MRTKNKNASDNENVNDIKIFQMNDDFGRVKSITYVSEAFWRDGQIIFNDKAEKIYIGRDGKLSRRYVTDYGLKTDKNPFRKIISKPSFENC